MICGSHNVNCLLAEISDESASRLWKTWSCFGEVKFMVMEWCNSHEVVQCLGYTRNGESVEFLTGKRRHFRNPIVITCIVCTASTDVQCLDGYVNGLAFIRTLSVFRRGDLRQQGPHCSLVCLFVFEWNTAASILQCTHCFLPFQYRECLRYVRLTARVQSILR